MPIPNVADSPMKLLQADEYFALEHVLTIRAEVREPIVVDSCGDERQLFFPITGGVVRGAFSGVVEAGGGDSCRESRDGCYHAEARYGIRTSDGHYIEVINTGILRHEKGESGGPQTMRYFFTAPRFRTASPDLQWLNRSMFIGKARTELTATIIDIFQIGNPTDGKEPQKGAF